MAAVNKDLLQQTLRGYAEVNEITAMERAASLARITREENWAAFQALYEAWKRTGQKAGGDWAALSEQRVADAIAVRRVFELLARHKGLL